MNKKECKECPIITTFDIIGKKWRIPIVWNLSLHKSMRYNELKRAVPGITNIMLTRTLNDLEKYKLVKRTQYAEIPPHVEYSITENCLGLMPALEIINKWSKEFVMTINLEDTND